MELFIKMLALIVLGISAVGGEVFTAQVEMEPLVSTQREIIESLNDYVAKEELKLQDIKNRVKRYENAVNKKSSELDIVSNPISAFLLVKSLTVDLDELVTFGKSFENEMELENKLGKYKENLQFPSSEDLTGAADALTRLQKTYLLMPSDIAKGELDGHCCTTELNAGDLFELGRQNYNKGNIEDTIIWMTEALLKSEEENSNMTRNTPIDFDLRVEILEYLAFTLYKQGNMFRAIDVTEDLLKLSPHHPRAESNLEYYYKYLKDQKGEDGEGLESTLTVREKRSPESNPEKDKYGSLCRGESQAIKTIGKDAICYYYTKNDPYLLIGPVKAEQLHVNPTITIFLDVMFDDEIEQIKKLAIPRFRRATVHDHATGELVFANYRISKSSWLTEEDDEVVARVCKRIKAITGLDLSTAEELQVVNYGLGGHYEPHFDFARRDEKDAFKSLGSGNRIATFLFYMNDVTAGGATVFPEIDLSMWPKKGAAAFWYNLLEDGTGDLSTRHAACPVLLGTKWVSNKWIHERGQEFRRKCNLKKSTPTKI